MRVGIICYVHPITMYVIIIYHKNIKYKQIEKKNALSFLEGMKQLIDRSHLSFYQSHQCKKEKRKKETIGLLAMA
jgi:hypothetical protein